MADPAPSDDRPAPPDLTDKYNTKLSKDEEAKYQEWGKDQATQNGGRNPALDTYDYDMRGFWRSGQDFSENGHAGDQFKKPNHPTFSDQSDYHGVDGYEGGHWTEGEGGKWSFDASKTNVEMHGAPGLQKYFGDVESGNTLNLPKPDAEDKAKLRRSILYDNPRSRRNG